jgi:hypothetical protein
VTSEQAGVGTTGVIIIQGTQANTESITLTLYNIDEPGTYPLGVTGANFGGTGVISTTTGRSWSTPPSGAAGTVTLTTLNATRIAGTFAFNATPLGGGATGTRVVTDGAFDLLLAANGNFGTLPDNQGSRMSGTVAGSPWTAATAFMTLTGGSLVVNASNDAYIIGVIKASFSGPGTYNVGLNPGDANVSAVALPAGGQTWAGGTGTFTVSSLTATRLRGTLTATLPGVGGGPSLSISNMEFDIGVP